jgi:hypothetical protein
VTTEFVSRLPLCTGGNEAHDVSAGSSIVETTGSVREEPEAEHHLRVEKARDSIRSYSSVVLGVTEPPNILGPPTDVLVLTTSYNHAGALNGSAGPVFLSLSHRPRALIP